MKKILIINPYYYPGFKSGGPQQTIINITQAFGDQFDFYVLTYNHDIGEKNEYQNIKDGWNTVGKAHVMYCGEQNYSIRMIANTAKGMDIVYACGLFEKTTIKTLIANKLKLINSGVYVAPMGVFGKNAFAQKKIKKHIFIFAMRFLGFFSNVKWSFTSSDELHDAQFYIGYKLKYKIASDIPRKPLTIENCSSKECGSLRVIFLSRICRQKNLKYVIDILNNVRGNITFDIYGIVEDKNYWDECKKALKQTSIMWEYRGEVMSDDVPNVFSKYNVFLFPTLSENFGHVIYEAMIGGCIPILSDQTPWGEIDQKCGDIISLNDKNGFQRIVQKYVEMDFNSWKAKSELASTYAKDYYISTVKYSGYLDMFNA